MVSNPAGFWKRLGASLLDGIIIAIPSTLIAFLIAGDADDNVISTSLSFLYTLIVPAVWAGYTVGKRALGVRIVKLDGSNVTIGTMALRTLVGGLIYAVTLGIGVIVSAFMVGIREDKRAIHDLIAGTYVTGNKP